MLSSWNQQNQHLFWRNRIWEFIWQDCPESDCQEHFPPQWCGNWSDCWKHQQLPDPGWCQMLGPIYSNISGFGWRAHHSTWIPAKRCFRKAWESQTSCLPSSFDPESSAVWRYKISSLNILHNTFIICFPLVQLSGYAGSSKIQVKVKQVELIDLLHKHYSLELENIGQLKSYAFVEFYRSNKSHFQTFHFIYNFIFLLFTEDGVNISPFVDPPFLVIPVEDVGKVDIIFPVSSVSNDDGKRCFVQVYWGDEELRLRWKRYECNFSKNCPIITNDIFKILVVLLKA